MSEQEVRLLVKKYNNGQATAQERALLENWYLTEGMNRHLSDEELDISHLKEELWAGTLLQAGLREKASRRFTWYRIAVAAMILLGLSVILHGYLASPSPSSSETEQVVQTIDVAPGGNKATLTLADGRTIDLSSDKDGVVIDAGKLAYDDGTQITVVNAKGEGLLPQKTAASLNTISTPKGGQYQVTLPDGSRVWLNAASSLTYPSHFGDNERRVEITGEAYFEVSSITSPGNKRVPFVVQTSNQKVTVLGTRFNISSYENEETIKTTLLEGAVNVLSLAGGVSTILKPGQQSIVQQGKMNVITVDLDEAIAWKNGEFVFYNEDIESVMKKIARWYDVEVIYETPIKNTSIWGSVSRFENISEVLKMIELTGSIHFKVSADGANVTERRVYVMK